MQNRTRTKSSAPSRYIADYAMKTSKAFTLLCATLMLENMLSMNIATAASDAPGYPESIYAYDSREVAMLPPYCKYTSLFSAHVSDKDPTEGRRWRDSLGPTFKAMHHYCWGLMHTNRALLLTRTQRIKSFHLSRSIDEFDYVLRHATEDFILLPEILTKKGENLIRLGKGAVAVIGLERAIQLKADYWPAYAALSDHYKSSGDLAKARALLEKALSFAPETTALKRRLVALDNVRAK